MAITFAGQPLLLEDPGRELQRWLDRALSLDDLRLFGSTFCAKHDGRDAHRTLARAFVGLPTPNWSTPPRPKINTLWWPTGASRWGWGLFLVTGEIWDKIKPLLDTDGGASLEFFEERPGETEVAKFSSQMYVLEPRQISQAQDAPTDLYLLPLVDKRYFWQHKDAGQLIVQCGSSWSGVFAQLAAGIGEEIEVDAISGGYLQPDIVELTRQYENAAQLLDAVAWSVGQRIVLALDGTVRSLNYESSQMIHEYNTTGWGAGLSAGAGLGDWTEKGYRIWAGGTEPLWEYSRRPATVRVVFPRYKNNEPQEDGNIWVETVAGSGYSEHTVPGRVKTFFDTCQADFTDDPPEPNNRSSLVAVTAQIAEDFYRHLPPATWDISFAGLRRWYPSGYDDWIWWHFGWQYPMAAEAFLDGNKESEGKHQFGTAFEGAAGECGDYACFTRVCSLPYNCEVTEQLHWECIEPSSSSSSSSESVSESVSESGGPPSESVGPGPQLCFLECGYFDDDNCYVTTKVTVQFPEGTTFVRGEKIRLEPCIQRSWESDGWSGSLSEGDIPSTGWPDCVEIVGTKAPDADGQYHRHPTGMHLGRPVYVDDAGRGWYLYYNGTVGRWRIDKLGDPRNWAHDGAGEGPFGTYDPEDGAVGTAAAIDCTTAPPSCDGCVHFESVDPVRPEGTVYAFEGDYNGVNRYNGQCWYQNAEFWFLWWGDDGWYVSSTLGELTSPHFARTTDGPTDIMGTYKAQGGAWWDLTATGCTT